MRRVVATFCILSATSSAMATERPAARVAVDTVSGVPVFADAPTDRPYTVVGEVRAAVRKPTVFSKASSEAKIYRELWERARKIGADAVIDARYGRSHVSAISWGETSATGTAIRFTAPSGR